MVAALGIDADVAGSTPSRRRCSPACSAACSARPGLYARPPDPVAAAVADLRTRRQGGTAIKPGAAAELLGDAGFTDVQVIFDPAWKVPIVCVVGTA